MAEELRKEKQSLYLYITEDRGVKKKILKERKGDIATEGSEVCINYLGNDKDNKIFDIIKNNPFTFKIGEHKVIKGLEIGLKTMKVGEIAEFVISQNYFYTNKKESGLFPEISELICQIELLKVKTPRKEISLMSYKEKLEEGKKLKGEGVEKYREGDITSAKDLFTRAIAYFENMDKSNETETEGINLYAITLSNLCNCCNKLKEYYAVINFATKGLKIKELSKFYYFRAIAYTNNDELDLAKKDLDSLKNLLQEKERVTDEGIKYVR